MTLDIKKYLKNLIEKEAKISHFQMTVYAGKTARMKQNFLAAIKQEFGDIYLEDADYVLFFEKSEPWTKDDIKKLFELTNRALGKDANMLSKNDFKQLPSASENVDSEKADDEETEDSDDETPENSEVENTESNVLFLKITLK